jgi:hypothetical protein
VKKRVNLAARKAAKNARKPSNNVIKARQAAKKAAKMTPLNKYKERMKNVPPEQVNRTIATMFNNDESKNNSAAAARKAEINAAVATAKQARNTAGTRRAAENWASQMAAKTKKKVGLSQSEINARKLAGAATRAARNEARKKVPVQNTFKERRELSSNLFQGGSRKIRKPKRGARTFRKKFALNDA